MIKNLIFLFNFIILLGCSSNSSVVSNPITGEKKEPGIFSKDSSKGISLSDMLSSQSSESSVNINGYLWRASLNVLSIAPLISTDALGGTIISDWYTNKNIQNKRIKIMAYKKTSELMKITNRIKKNRKGNFIHIKIKGHGKIIEELEKNERLDKNLLRYMTVKVKKFDLEANYFGKQEEK
jgi:ribosomal protein S6